MPIKSDSEQELLSVLDARPYQLSDKQKSKLFKSNLLKELNHHYKNNELYRKFCKKHLFEPATFSGELTDIPAIPVHIFKALGHKLSSVSPELIKTTLQSSATSGVPSTVLLDKITSRRQIKAMARVLQEVLGSKRRPFCVMDIDPASPNAVNLGARIAAVKGYLNFASSSDYFIDANSPTAPLEFLQQKFIEYLENLKSDEPVVIFGFTFVLYHSVFKVLKERNISFQLPIGSQVIHIGGWKKLESEKVSKEIFNSDIAGVLGIPAENVIDIYGFTEQMGLNYPDCKAGWKHVHAYSDVIIRDESDLSVCPNGQSGLLEFISPLQHSYPGNVVLTDDLGVIEEGQCNCGRKGKRFKVIGRAKKAEVRGCGDVMSEKVSSVSNKRKLSETESMIIYHSPIDVDYSLHPTEQLKQIFAALEQKKNWLSEQPLEALIGLIDTARERWADDTALDSFRSNGLNFLIEWSEPSRLKALLDSSLHGRRGHLDSFLPRKDISSSSLKALPRGTVAHWLSGNVPLLGMFALIQSIVCKNTNILKVSADESQALPALLKTFKDISYTSPGGYTIFGNDLLESIAVVYFDRHQIKTAECFSGHADVRIAWGGREAVEAVSQLPKKYNCQDVLFGPKLSMMVIGCEALSTEKQIRKLVRRAATDSSVFDQYACASPHTIFVEKGAKITPLEFAEKLALAMDKALIRLPTQVPDIGQTNKIRSKIAEYKFIGESWNDRHLRWTVLYDEGDSLVEPTYHRVITVKAVDDVFNVIPNVTSDIQTVGLAMHGEKRLRFAEKITFQGAVRCPDIGYMTHFDSPWDGLFVADRLVRWVSLGGPR
ncbi:LuxE/PaaK family acyltransferase [Vibrio sp. SCSIO 43137]|uniref:LuxE/PaaK family acyltransferase n=1 Tax=Vibrio sp. SCSIO 43137 TaxID=3021011 RepID=UPI002307C255|nr:acyl-CoA reductase [Vibrio sp. SCSIO 43137]WCE29854.1 acyl-CoA reductase [Vibrio sp. SCSIO 43137]